jgi:hypothetical protein
MFRLADLGHCPPAEHNERFVPPESARSGHQVAAPFRPCDDQNGIWCAAEVAKFPGGCSPMGVTIVVGSHDHRRFARESAVHG